MIGDEVFAGWQPPDDEETLPPDAVVAASNGKPETTVERHARAKIDWPTLWASGGQTGEWLVEPLLPAGRGIATYSPPKVGKSILALDVAARLATGQRILDTPTGLPVRGLYLDAEMTQDDVRDRLDDMNFGPEDDLEPLAYYLLPDLPPLDTAAGGRELLELAIAHQATFVVIDTTTSLLEGKEDASDTIRAYWRHTGRHLSAAGLTAWRLDHAGKDLTRGQRGSSQKAGDVDVVWELTATDNGFRLRATHRRMGWVPETVDIVRLADPLRHEIAIQSWPAGTAECANHLAAIGLDVNTGAKIARVALRAAGHQHRNDVIAAAIRYRRKGTE